MSGFLCGSAALREIYLLGVFLLAFSKRKNVECGKCSAPQRTARVHRARERANAMLRLQRMLTRRGFLWILAALSILPAALAFGAPGAAAQETPRKSAKPEPPNEEYLRKVIKWNPWFLAAASGDTKTIQDYLTSGTQVNARDTFGRTALYVATAYEHADIVRLLLKSGADPTGPHRSGQTARDIAAQSGNKQIEALFPKAETEVAAAPSVHTRIEELPSFWQAIEDESTPTLRALLKKGSFTREGNLLSGYSVPLRALGRGRMGLYSILLEQGLGPSGTQEEKNTLLQAAAMYRRTQDFQRLLDAGASIACISYHEFQRSIEKRDKVFLRVLLDAGAKPTDGLIYLAVGTGDVELVKLLCERGVSVRTQNSGTLLAVAVGKGDIKMVEYLLDMGADPKAYGERDLTLVEHALSRKREDIADLLIQKGAKPVSEERRTFLLKPARDYTVTTETLVSAQTLSTGSLVSAIDLSEYNLYQVTRKENTPEYPDIRIDRFLVFAGSPDRILVGQLGREEEFYVWERTRNVDGQDLGPGWTGTLRDCPKDDQESVKLAWLEPGRIVIVRWCYRMAGQGGGTEERMAILAVKGNRVRMVLSWGALLYMWGGGGCYTTGNQAWSWDSREKVLSVRYTRKGHSEMDLHTTRRLMVPLSDYSGDEIPRSEGGTETTWRYRLLGDRFEYLGGQQVEKIAGGFPVLDVAEEYGLTIRRLVELNAELQGKVFCTGPVVVSTSISPIDKDR